MLRQKTGTESSDPEENTREKSHAGAARDGGLHPLYFLIPALHSQAELKESITI